MASSLHLSLLRLPRADTRWRHLDAYQAHQVLWNAFPGIPREPPGARPFLFSLDPRATPAGGVQSLLVQSTVAPDWSGLGDGAEVRTKTVAADAFAAGTRLAFSLRANPTSSRAGYVEQTYTDRKGVERPVTRRIGVGLDPAHAFARMGRPDDAPTTPEAVAAWRDGELRAWLERQGARGGFAVETATPGPIVSRRIVRPRERGERAMTFHEDEYAGVLTVTDASAFASTRAAGIGRGRSFGYGLLMVRPA